MATESNLGRGPRLVSLGSIEPIQVRLGPRRLVVGRDPANDLKLDDSRVSARHAVIRRRFGRYRLTDLESDNGTYVNGRRIRATTTLVPGDEIRFASQRFAFLNPVGSTAKRGQTDLRLREIVQVFAIVVLLAFSVTEYVINRHLVGRIGRRNRPPAAEASAVPLATFAPLVTPAAQPTTVPAAPTAAAEATPAVIVAPTPAVAAPAPAPTRAANEPAWLRRVNYYRTLAKLPFITEDPALSAADLAHARYLVRNFAGTIRHVGLGAEAHMESPSLPGYSAAGLKAAQSSNVNGWWASNPRTLVTDPAASIDEWVATPFHRLWILNPGLHGAGFGQFCEAGVCASALNIGSDIDPMPSFGIAFAAPIEFPPDGATVALRRFNLEWPDPLASCPSYGTPAGLAITLQLGAWITPSLNDYAIRRQTDSGNDKVEACGFDANGYVNPDPAQQERARDVLKANGAVMVVPRLPLNAGAVYDVSMTVNGKVYQWSFTVSSSAK